MKDYKMIKDEIIEFLKRHFEVSGAKSFILGISGGIDSTLVLALAVEAVGKENIKVYSLPYFEALNSSIKALDIAFHYDVWKMTICIKPIVDIFGVNSTYRLGNIMARTRMTILYDQAMSYNGLVLNTCNLSEDLIGYATKFGDAAGDLAPIAHLTKNEVYELAEYMKIPEEFINRVPSAELWEGQSDSGELKFSYDELDSIIDKYRINCYSSINKSFTVDFPTWMFTHKRLFDIPVSEYIWDIIYDKACKALHKLNPMPSLIHY
jgi:NAD+ synthase